MRLDRRDRELAEVPIVAWTGGGHTSLAARAGSGDFRCESFHRVQRHDGTGLDRFDNRAECVATLFRVQADHARDPRQEAEQPPAC